MIIILNLKKEVTSLRSSLDVNHCYDPRSIIIPLRWTHPGGPDPGPRLLCLWSSRSSFQVCQTSPCLELSRPVIIPSQCGKDWRSDPGSSETSIHSPLWLAWISNSWLFPTLLEKKRSRWLISILVNIMRFYTSHFSDYFCLCLAHKWPSTGSKTTRCLVIGYFLFILTYSFGVDQLQAQQGVYSLGRQWNPAFFLFLPFFG